MVACTSPFVQLLAPTMKPRPLNSVGSTAVWTQGEWKGKGVKKDYGKTARLAPGKEKKPSEA